MTATASATASREAVLQEVNRRRKRRGWTPFPGPQLAAFLACRYVDVVGYGGAAGGGKTDLDLGVAYLLHRRSIIFRRTYPTLAGIIERSRSLFGRRGRYREGEHEWRVLRRCDHAGRPLPRPVRVTIRFGSMQREADREKHRGNPYDLMVFDEAQNFLEAQVRFVLAWNRTDLAGQHSGALLTFNPPTEPEGLWLLDFFAPWLDPKHENPAEDGEARWFVTTPEGRDEEVPGPEPVEQGGRVLIPRSRTFFRALVTDNPVYMATGYIATLDALPEPLRSQMRDGDFTAGLEDDAWQVIPTKWVQAAMERGRRMPRRPLLANGTPAPLSGVGVDVAAGGRDKTAIARRYTVRPGSSDGAGAKVLHWFAPVLAYPGSQTPDGATAAGKVLLAMAEDGETSAAVTVRPNIDAIGVGQGLRTALTMQKVAFNPVNVAHTSSARDKSRRLTFKNVKAEMYWRMREALDPENPLEEIALPDSRELLADLTAPRWSMTPGGIEIESKDETIKRLGRSPDVGEAVMLAHFDKGGTLVTQ